MRYALIGLFISIAVTGRCQQDTALSLPVKNRIVFYEREYHLNNSTSAIERFKRASAWFSRAFPDSKEPLKISDKRAGKIQSIGIFKVITGDPVSTGTNQDQAFYWIKCVVEVSITDDGYLFQAYDFYEKPMYKGVTNDYSKVEYRWRDFVKDKPWTPGDRRLFKGLDQMTQGIMSSLEKAMNGT